MAADIPSVSVKSEWSREWRTAGDVLVIERIRAARDLVLHGIETRCDFALGSVCGDAAAFLQRQFNLDKPPGVPEKETTYPTAESPSVTAEIDDRLSRYLHANVETRILEPDELLPEGVVNPVTIDREAFLRP